MRIIAPALICLLMPLCGMSQIEGIGPFKIGKTTTKIIDSLQSSYVSVTRAGFNTGDTLIIPHWKYKVGSFDLAGMLFMDVQLDFYNDTLYHITIIDLPDNFDKMLLTKYGSGVEKHTKAAAKCKNRSGGTFTVYDERIDHEYNSGRITSTLVITKYYDNRCIQMPGGYFYLSDPAKFMAVHDMEQIAKRRYKEEKERKNISEF